MSTPDPLIRDNIFLPPDPDKPGWIVPSTSGFTLKNCWLKLEDGTVRPIPDYPPADEETP